MAAAPSPRVPHTEVETAPHSRTSFRLPEMLRALRHRNYRLFFMGQLISLIGTWMQQVAQGWLVLRLTDSPLQLGLVSVAASLPVLLLSLPAGVLVDRVPKRGLLIVAQVAAMLLALTLALITILDIVQVWHVMVLAALLGTVNAFDATARQAFAVELVAREDLLNAIALNSSIFNGARTIGPAVAGLLVAAIGEGPAFLLNGLSFVAVIAGLLMMRLDQVARTDRRRSTGSGREGLLYIAQEPLVRTLLLLVGGISFFGFVYIPLMPIFARDILKAGASGLGWMSASNGAGALIGSVLLARFGDWMRRNGMLMVTAVLNPIFVIGFAASGSLPLAMLMLALMGWSGVTTMALTNTLIQTTVPDELRGRVMSVFTLLLMGLSPLGGLGVGTLAELLGSTPLAVALSACVSLVLALTIVFFSPVLRKGR